MVNTVGSCEIKYWHKKWQSIKPSLSLTKEQRELILGSLLGDGTMRVGENARNANFKVEHGLAQKEFVFWKYEILKPFVFTEPKLSYRYRENGETYQKSWWFRTVRHPDLTEIYNNFYLSGGGRTMKKSVPNSIEREITPLALAVWIMDDGSYNRGQIDISTYSFSFEEIRFLQDCLRNSFDLKSRSYRDRDKGYRLYFSKGETNALIQIIYPCIIPSMMYKIGFTTP